MKKPLTFKQKAGGAVLAASATLVGTVAMWEGTEYVPYRDTGGVLTVCQGYTGPGIVPGKVYTKAECDQLLIQELSHHGQGLLKCTNVPLNQNQYDALVSFTYNMGVGAACSSRALRLVNQGNYEQGCRAIAHGPSGFRSKWCKTRQCQSYRQNNADPVNSYDNGVFYRGLQNRRAAERDLCLKPMPLPQPAEVATS